jgi:hypothetical protein
MSDLKMAGNGIEIVAGSFAPDTANAPTALKGRGFTVARTSTGLFTVTLTNRFAGLVSMSLGLQLASGDDKILQIGTVTISHAAACTFQIRCWDISAAAVADIAANANNRVNFIAVLKRNDVVDGTGI